MILYPDMSTTCTDPALLIRDKLLTGIDEDYNVTDMTVVQDVIGELENFHITKEALETTRLGKHINELRRKSSDKSLANRAKSLVKKWRNMFSSATMGGGGGGADHGPPPGGGTGPPLQPPNGRLSTVSPGLARPPSVNNTLSPRLGGSGTVTPSNLSPGLPSSASAAAYRLNPSSNISPGMPSRSPAPRSNNHLVQRGGGGGTGAAGLTPGTAVRPGPAGGGTLSPSVAAPSQNHNYVGSRVSNHRHHRHNLSPSSVGSSSNSAWLTNNQAKRSGGHQQQHPGSRGAGSASSRGPSPAMVTLSSGESSPANSRPCSPGNQAGGAPGAVSDIRFINSSSTGLPSQPNTRSPSPEIEIIDEVRVVNSAPPSRAPSVGSSSTPVAANNNGMGKKRKRRRDERSDKGNIYTDPRNSRPADDHIIEDGDSKDAHDNEDEIVIESERPAKRSRPASDFSNQNNRHQHRDPPPPSRHLNGGKESSSDRAYSSKSAHSSSRHKKRMRSKDGRLPANDGQPLQQPHNSSAPASPDNVLNKQISMAKRAGKVKTTRELIENLGLETSFQGPHPPNGSSRASSPSATTPHKASSASVSSLVPNENKEELMQRFFESQRMVSHHAANHSQKRTGGAASSVITLSGRSTPTDSRPCSASGGAIITLTSASNTPSIVSGGIGGFSRPGTALSVIDEADEVGGVTDDVSVKRTTLSEGAKTVEELLALLPPIDDPAAVIAHWQAKAEAEEQEAGGHNTDDEENIPGLIPKYRSPCGDSSAPASRSRGRRRSIDADCLNNAAGGDDNATVSEYVAAKLEHIGGIVDMNGVYREWHEMAEVATKDGETLHVLPYTVID